VIVGFTNGIAILIASTQIKDFFGLQTGPVPGRFCGAHAGGAGACAHTASLTTTVLSCAALLLILLIRRFLPRIPGYIVALVGATLVVYFAHLPVETIGTRLAGFPRAFPASMCRCSITPP
jgi:SulP family sulfate permease